MHRIIFTKEFWETLQLYGAGRKSLVLKIMEVKSHLQQYGLNVEFFDRFNTQSLGDWFFRVKFIPYRVIIHITSTEIIFVELFKRKWKSDYKKYS